MFGWEFPPFNSGGLGTACAGMARALVDEGNEVLFVLPKRIPVGEIPGIRFLFADIPDTAPSPYIGSFEYKKLYGSPLANQVGLYAIRARQIAAENEFDMIHAHDWLSFGAGIAAKEVSGKPLVVHVHATQFDHAGGGEPDQELARLEREGMQAADAVITVSNFTREVVVARHHIDPAKITVIHNGVEAAEEDPAIAEWVERLRAFKGGKKLVLFLGRITLMKGPDYFLRAAKKTLEFFPDAVFVMAGTGDMENQMVREAAQLGIADKVIFAGFARGKELTALYRAADLYVLPSVSEPFGITPLESLVAGTPVLVSKQSGVSEVVKHALKADFWDVDDMADKIVSVLRHPELRETLAVNGQREAKSLTWKKVAQKLGDLYRKVFSFLKRRGGASPKG